MTCPDLDYVMVVTSEQDVTADMVIESLNARRAPVVRVDPADIGPGLSFHARLGAAGSCWSGRLRTSSRDIALERVRAFYYRRPSPWRFENLKPQARAFAIAEARYGLSGLLHSLPDCHYVNHPAAVVVGEHKPAQLQVAVQVGFTVPETLITNDLDAATSFATEHSPMIYKAFRGLPLGTDDQARAIWTQRVDPVELDESIAVTAHLFQAEVPKHSDARVTVVGTRVFASQIISPENALDWRSGDHDSLTYVPIAVPEHVMRALRAYLDAFGLVFGCFDFALEETGQAAEPYRWIFIECNPNGQWGWLPDSDAIADSFAETLLQGWFV
ncbi:ATP-grasp ribosomal peptide maturase [Streptosporangium algeriense]|uniref:ATP-grasp ribosomal peptide maturase n=1 Tax=Streptosporangium algeriense TaxID=1682748 RepID=A0ABW3DMK2_9ACTN